MVEKVNAYLLPWSLRKCRWHHWFSMVSFLFAARCARGNHVFDLLPETRPQYRVKGSLTTFADFLVSCVNFVQDAV